MGIKEDTQTLNNLAVQKVGLLLGVKLPAKGMSRCPLPAHDDATPSFEVRAGGIRWICYGCNRKGGAIDFVMAIRRLSFLEAKRWLAQASGLLDQINRQELRAHILPRATERGAPQPFSLGRRVELPHFATASLSTLNSNNQVTETQPDHELYAALLAVAPLLTTGKDYLLARCLSAEIITRFAVGQMPNNSAITELIRHFGFERVAASGLLIQSSTHDRYMTIFPPGALLFPYTEKGQIVYLQARGIAGGVKGSRWRNLNYRRRRIYNSDILVAPKIGRVGICEGAIDVLSAAQLGCDAIGLIGVGAQLTEDQIMALRGRQVDLLLDWDKAGDKRAVTLRKELARFGVAATRKTSPQSGATDVNDYLCEGNTSL